MRPIGKLFLVESSVYIGGNKVLNMLSVKIEKKGQFERH